MSEKVVSIKKNSDDPADWTLAEMCQYVVDNPDEFEEYEGATLVMLDRGEGGNFYFVRQLFQGDMRTSEFALLLDAAHHQLLNEFL